MFTACVTAEKDGTPVTPTILAHAGDQVRIRVFGAFNEQNQIFTLEGHEWPLKPNMVGADMLSSLQFGSSEFLDVYIKEGAGGPFHLPGDYIWQNARMPYAAAGEWGYLRVLPVGDHRIQPLNREGGPGMETASAPDQGGSSKADASGSAPVPVSMLRK